MIEIRGAEVKESPLNKNTRYKDIRGLVYIGSRMGEAEVTVRVTHDEKGKSLSLASDVAGVMIMIPLEQVDDMLEVVDG